MLENNNRQPEQIEEVVETITEKTETQHLCKCKKSKNDPERECNCGKMEKKAKKAKKKEEKKKKSHKSEDDTYSRVRPNFKYPEATKKDFKKFKMGHVYKEPYNKKCSDIYNTLFGGPSLPYASYDTSKRLGKMKKYYAECSAASLELTHTANLIMINDDIDTRAGLLAVAIRDHLLGFKSVPLAMRLLNAFIVSMSSFVESKYLSTKVPVEDGAIWISSMRFISEPASTDDDKSYGILRVDGDHVDINMWCIKNILVGVLNHDPYKLNNMLDALKIMASPISIIGHLQF